MSVDFIRKTKYLISRDAVALSFRMFLNLGWAGYKMDKKDKTALCASMKNTGWMTGISEAKPCSRYSCRVSERKKVLLKKETVIFSILFLSIFIRIIRGSVKKSNGTKAFTVKYLFPGGIRRLAGNVILKSSRSPRA
jgi:hypothetical protein